MTFLIKCIFTENMGLNSILNYQIVSLFYQNESFFHPLDFLPAY